MHSWKSIAQSIAAGCLKQSHWLWTEWREVCAKVIFAAHLRTASSQGTLTSCCGQDLKLLLPQEAISFCPHTTSLQKQHFLEKLPLLPPQKSVNYKSPHRSLASWLEIHSTTNISPPASSSTGDNSWSKAAIFKTEVAFHSVKEKSLLIMQLFKSHSQDVHLSSESIIYNLPTHTRTLQSDRCSHRK